MKIQGIKVRWSRMTEGLEQGGRMVFKNPVTDLSCSYMRSSPFCQYKIQSL